MAGLKALVLGLLVVSCSASVLRERLTRTDGPQSGQMNITEVFGKMVQFWTRTHDPQPGQMNIKEAFTESGTDKLWRHGYHRFYETALAPYKNLEDLAILEIGAEQGKSLMSWVNYFSKPSRVDALAYQADPVQAKAKACEAGELLCKVVAIYSVDQSDPEQLENMVKEVNEKAPQHPGWDVIIDDGSHVPMHQLTTFKHLFPKLRPGGLYIVEDIETSYIAGDARVYDYPLSAGIEAPPGVSAVNKFKELVDVVNRKHFLADSLSVFGTEVDSTVAKLSFVDNVIFIEKQPDDETWNMYPVRPFFAAQQKANISNATAHAVHKFQVHVAKELPIP